MNPNLHPAYLAEEALYTERAKVETSAELAVWVISRREKMMQDLDTPGLPAEVRANLAASVRYLRTVT